MRGIRTVLFMTFMVVLTVIMGLLFLPMLALPRRWLMGPKRLWCRLVLGAFSRLIGVETEIRGAARIPDGPILVASKHQAMWDTVIVFLVFNDPAVILKRELMRIPIYGWYGWKLGMIPIDREAKASALRKMVAASKDRLAHGRPVVIFPEGSRAAPGSKLEYKPGVAALYRQLGDVPCVPIALTSGLCWPRSGFGFKPGKIILEILDPIPPGLERKAFMATLETTIETATDRLIAEARASSAGL